MAKKKKIRVEMRKNRSKPPRQRNWTRGFQEHGFTDEATLGKEQVRAKGDLSRRRTIIQDETPAAAEAGQEPAEMPAVDISACLPGRVLRVHGLVSVVETEDGRQFRCAVRRLLRTLATDERNIVTTGDRVWLRPARSAERGVRSEEKPDPARSAERGTRNEEEPEPARSAERGTRNEEEPEPARSAERGTRNEEEPEPDSRSALRIPSSALEGVIERVEPRHGLLTRASRGREHVLVANVDQVVIVMSLVEPDLKPHLIDRYLASAAQGGIRPLICLNKADLVDSMAVQPLIGFYSQLAIPTLLTSTRTGLGIERLRGWLRDRQTVFSGQSGVGKSSLLNALQPGLGLRVREVSEMNQKGRHTTTTAQLLRLDFGGWVVDTPGLRQFQLWDIIPEEVEGFFPEFRPFVPLCGYPDCTHTHEDRCAVKKAVERRLISARRYTSYLGLFRGETPDL
jgi:ribosome biogenesis GTPase